MDSTITATRLHKTARARLHPVKSIAKEMIFSNTAMMVEIAAKDIHRKKMLPQTLPPLIALKMFGSVMNTSPGPLPGFTPNAKLAGKMIIPATSATKVSSTVTQIASPVSARDRSI